MFSKEPGVPAPFLFFMSRAFPTKMVLKNRQGSGERSRTMDHMLQCGAEGKVAMHKLSFGRTGLLFVSLLLAACNYGATRNTPTAPTSGSKEHESGNNVVDSQVKKYGAQQPSFMPGSIKVTKAWIEPSTVKHLTGDLRPTWLINRVR